MSSSSKLKKIIKKETDLTIVSGKDKGKSGKCLKVDKKKNLVWIKGLKLAKKSIKDSDKTKSKLIDIEMPINISNVKKA